MRALRFSWPQARHAVPPAAAVRTLSARASGGAGGGSLHLRPGRPSDRSALWRLALKERLNPLGLDPERCMVAERGGRTIGVGQLKSLSGGRALKLATLVVEHGERGGGVGTALVQDLVQRAGGTPIYLITTSQRTRLFQRCGFGEVERAEAPAALQIEFLAGLVVAWLVAWDRLVLMRCAPASGGGAARRRPSVASRATDSYDDGGDVYIDLSEALSPWWRGRPAWGAELPESPEGGEEPPNSAEGGEEPPNGAEGGEEPPNGAEGGGEPSESPESGDASSGGWQLPDLQLPDLQWPDSGGLGWGGSSTGGDAGGDSASGGADAAGDSYGGSFGGDSYGGGSWGGGSFGGGSFGGGSFDSGGSDGGGDD